MIANVNLSDFGPATSMVNTKNRNLKNLRGLIN